MRKDLAESLLARVMGWSAEEKATERMRLESFASYKYDEYQQFSPGRRFIESLALWLMQFDSGDERRVAYGFVCRRLLFVTAKEMNHLVELAFPTKIRPRIMEDAARDLGVDPDRVKHVVASQEYRARLRRTLVLGLSDGARTDWFRRANPLDMSNDQVFHAYDVSAAKAKDLVEDLKKDLAAILGRQATKEEATFQYVVLLDDFSGSGTSSIRREKNGEWGGKIGKIVRGLESDKEIGGAIAEGGVAVMVVLYVASDQAIEYLQTNLGRLEFSKGDVSFAFVHGLGPLAPLGVPGDAAFLDLARQERYFDPRADDSHGEKGGTSKRLGYAEGRLPLVLAHNTPNNSMYLLWAEEAHRVRGLFPRVSRHRDLQRA